MKVLFWLIIDYNLATRPKQNPPIARAKKVEENMKKAIWGPVVGVLTVLVICCSESSQEPVQGQAPANVPPMVQTSNVNAPPPPVAQNPNSEPLLAKPVTDEPGSPANPASAGSETTGKPGGTKPVVKPTQADMPNPAAQHCKDSGGIVVSVKSKSGPVEVCKWRNATQCEIWRFYRQQCKMGECKHPTGICPDKPGQVGAPNPASVKCKKAGAKVERLKTDEGEIGICVWPDYSRCEEWRFFYGKCKKGECRQKRGICPDTPDQTSGANPASVYCKKTGGALQIIKTEKGESGVCYWRDGSRCEEWRLYRKQCKRGECKAKNGICEQATQIGQAKPAAAYCKETGGAYKKTGKTGICMWRDGSRCEGSRLMKKTCKRGDCRAKSGICPEGGGKPPQTGMANPASVHCKKNGGKVRMVNTPKGQIGVCEFLDGSRCEEWQFFRKQCKRGHCRAKNGMCPERNRKHSKGAAATR